MTEFERIAKLSRSFGKPRAPAVGIGDDAAVLPSVLPLVVTVDAAIEGVHFDREIIGLEVVAGRAIAAAVSDIAAMGARVDVDGCGLLLSWVLPASVTDAEFDALVEGSAAAAARLGVFIVGGNLSRGQEIGLHTTVLGRCTRGSVLSRAGARAGDAVAVTGTPGAAAIGLRTLMAVEPCEDTGARECVRAWKYPTPRVDEGCALVGRASACVDVSDGLAQDLGHVAKASGVSVVIDTATLPIGDAMRNAARSVGLDPTEAALHGGEDYELVATGPREVFGPRWTVIGTVIAAREEWVYLRGDVEDTALKARGWQHF